MEHQDEQAKNLSEMWRPKPLAVVVLAFSAIIALVVVPSPASATGEPLVTAITKDASTSLYTAPIKDGRPLVVDLSGALVWSTCAADHPTLECHHRDCMHAHSYHPPACPHNGYGRADEENPFRCVCRAHPHNPFSGETASGDVVHATLSANATDGKNPLREVSFTAVTSCTPDSLLARLPAGAVGVAGLGRSRLAFPAQVARTQKVAGEFALCLPSGGQGVAIFGGGPLFLLPPGRPDVKATLAGETPLHRVKGFPGYFISADKGIAVNQVQVHLPDERGGPPLLVGLSSRVPYTLLRPDVYRAFVAAFDRAATAEMSRITPAPAPFELCYNSTKLGSTRLGYAVPQIDLMLEGGKNWTVFGGNSMAQVNGDTACLAFVQMAAADEARYGGAALPAVVLGGFQMENNLLVLDNDKGKLGFSGLLLGRQTTCSNFNFTLAA